MANLDRRLEPRRPLSRSRSRLPLRLAVVSLALLGLGLLAGQLDLRDDFRHLNVGFLSGYAEGNYRAIAQELAERAARERGQLRVLPSEGSSDNIARLRATRESCEVAFGLAQDGSDFGAKGELQLIGRLAKAESVFFLGKQADALTELGQLAHARIGVGPQGSGSAQLVARLFQLSELTPLGVELRHGSIGQQLEQLDRGELELQVVVLDEDAPWLGDVIRSRRAQIAGLPRLDVLARRLPHLRTGRIGAGQFEPVAVLPPVDKRVLRVDTLIIGNGCASRSTTLNLMSVVAQQFPDFVRHNQETANTTELELAAPARDYFEHGGPELVERHAPWLVDLMPPANWAYFALAASVLLNAMGLGHRFRLWRIDVARVKLEAEIAGLFGATATLGDIARAEPAADSPAVLQRAELVRVIDELAALAERSRRQSLSLLVPMGQEMSYRYQESLINDALAVLRGFLARSTHGG